MRCRLKFHNFKNPASQLRTGRVERRRTLTPSIFSMGLKKKARSMGKYFGLIEVLIIQTCPVGRFKRFFGFVCPATFGTFSNPGVTVLTRNIAFLTTSRHQTLVAFGAIHQTLRSLYRTYAHILFPLFAIFRSFKTR